jgi:hypothetical protein
MKQLTFFSLALLLAACGHQEAPVETTTPPGNDGLGVAITVFAQWQRGSQGTLDGEYDSREGMFVPCGSTQGMPIKPDEVKVISGGSCDGLPKKLEPDVLIVRRSGKTFNVVSRNVTLQEVTSEKGRGEYQTSAGTKQIEVDRETLNRIKAEPKLLEKVQRKP